MNGTICNPKSLQKQFLLQESLESPACKGVHQSDGEIERSRFRSPSKSNRKLSSFNGGCGESEKTIAENNTSHIRECSHTSNLPVGKAWKVLQKDIKRKAFKLYKAQALSPANRLTRKSPCEIWLILSELWFERVMWTDEKWCV